MLQTTQIAIIYDCKVAESGYAYLDPGLKLKPSEFSRPWLSPEKSKHIATNRKFLVQRVKSQVPRVKPFTYEAVKDFKVLGEIQDLNQFNDDRINFSNKWGPLVKLKEDNSTFRELLNILLDSEYARRRSEYPPLNCGFDPLNHKNQVLHWDYDRDGRLVPAFKPKSLFNSIYLAWGLRVQSEKERKICKYFKLYGERKSCNHYFQDTRGDREFCSKNCSNAFRQKPDWQEKVRRDIDLRITRSRIKLERVNKKISDETKKPQA
jgi:hypothetical protein